MRNATPCGRKWHLVNTVQGGIVNAGGAFVYEADKKRIFVKRNNTAHSRAMFECEYESLLSLQATNTVRVPEPVAFIHPNEQSEEVALVIEYLEGMVPIAQPDIWRQLGEEIARLHLHNGDQIRRSEARTSSVHCKDDPVPVRRFGYHKAHYFGPTFHVPGDVWEDSWQEYLCRHLFSPLIAVYEEKIGRDVLSEQWSFLQLHLSKLFRDRQEHPSLLHGDLFDINVGTDGGKPVVFDPQSYYGDAEIECAWHLPSDYQKGYYSVMSQQDNFQQRRLVYEYFVHILLATCGEDLEANKTDAHKKGEQLISLIKQL